MSVSTIGVIGAGVMGSGIAQVAATKGIDVILLDVSEKTVKTGIDAVERRLSAVVTKGKMTPAEKDAALRAYSRRFPAPAIGDGGVAAVDVGRQSEAAFGSWSTARIGTLPRSSSMQPSQLCTTFHGAVRKGCTHVAAQKIHLRAWS
jgi:3-hydroxyacyl-CoA dehydrogenase, NAD binding domain